MELLLSIAIGMIAGGVTNAVAVWMLFHPYERRFGVHGAIPKNKARLAKRIGRTVGEKLLTPEDVLEELRRAGVPEALDRLTADLAARPIHGVLTAPRREALAARAAALFLELLAERRVGGALLRAAGQDRTRSFIERIAGEALERVGHRPWGEVIDAVGRPALWELLERELPSWLERLDIPAMVERKVLGFDMIRIEEIVRSVTQRELTLIVHLGYLLGAIIGLVSFLGRRLLTG
jgi:uncharacterized membrane protein YheB (UPF0754 family)